VIEQNRTLKGFFGAVTRVVVMATIAGGLISVYESSTAIAQSATREIRAVDLLDDFTHYVFIANDDLAEASARAILDLSMDPTDFLAMVEDDPRLEDKFEQSYRKALLRPGLESVASDLFQLYEDGRRARSRDISEIRRNIGLLTGGARAKRLARARLVEATSCPGASLNSSPIALPGHNFVQNPPPPAWPRSAHSRCCVPSDDAAERRQHGIGTLGGRSRS